MRKPRQGSFSKSGTGSEQLNELMLRYAQDNQVQNVTGCLLKGADVDYKNGALLLIACYLGHKTLLKLILKARPKKGLEAATKILEQATDDKMLTLLNDYLKQIGADV